MIAPGSQFGIDHPFTWYVIFKDKTDGRQLTMWLASSFQTREQVADHVRVHYHNMEVITIDRAMGQPTRMLTPIPPHLFQFGILKAMEQADSDAPQSIKRQPIIRRPIQRISR